MTYKKRKVRRYVLGRVYAEGHSAEKLYLQREEEVTPHRTSRVSGLLWLCPGYKRRRWERRGRRWWGKRRKRDGRQRQVRCTGSSEGSNSRACLPDSLRQRPPRGSGINTSEKRNKPVPPNIL